MITQQDFYQKLRLRMREWLATREGKQHKFAEYLMVAPDLFYLLIKLAIDQRVAITDKAKLAVAITYFISPIDLIPEALVGPGGFVDDIALAAYVLNSVVNNTDIAVLRDHWVGDEDVLAVIKKIIAAADSMVGMGLWEKLKNLVRN